MATKQIKLNYLSVERFLRDYAQLRKGKIFLPAKAPLPENTRVVLKIFIPVIEQEAAVEGVVVRILDAQTTAASQKQKGMLVRLAESPATALKYLNDVLSTYEDYRDLLDLSPPNSSLPKKLDAAQEPPLKKLRPSENNEFDAPTPAVGMHQTAESGYPFKQINASSGSPTQAAKKRAEMQPNDSTPVENGMNLASETNAQAGDALSMEWLRKAIAQKAATREKEDATQIAVAPTTVKQQLTEEDRDRVKPAGEFLIDLTKAMLRSDYYAPDHPGSQDAKKALYESLHKCLADSREIMVASQVMRQSSEILITGILDEPVNVRMLVGAGMADLFVPKLQEYFNRKSLVSFAVKKDISLEHFKSFVDIMSDPKADSGTGKKFGELLSNALVGHGISQISTVFKDDLIALKLNLPWRVEMAIQRLAKDLTVLPMFKNESDAAIHTMKLQIIQDILRPLKHPEFLKDLIINCYIIAQHVKTLQTEDIEKVIIEAFPLDSLLPTSQLIFEELNHLQNMQKEHQVNAILERGLSGVKRILKWVSQRLVLEDVKGAQKFLENLYINQVLTFEELPADVQYLVNTAKMAEDVQTHIQRYVKRILQIKAVGDAAILLSLFRRVLPALIEASSWKTVFYLTRAMDKTAKTSGLFKPASGLPTNPLKFVFQESIKEIVVAYNQVDNSQRKIINGICDQLAMMGIEILSKALSASQDRTARKSAMEALIDKGGLARDWVLEVLDNPGQKWYLIRNALMLLGYVGEDKQDIARAFDYLHHENPRVRFEALNVLIRRKVEGTEKRIIAALDDLDDKVRWRALNGLSELEMVSEDTIRSLLAAITAEAPEDKDEAGKHNRNIAQLIRALGAIPQLANHADAEEAILGIARALSNQRKGMLKRFKKTSLSDQIMVQSSAINSLGNIGTTKSESFLEKLAESKSPLAEAAQKAANNIKLRAIEQLSDTPADKPRPASANNQ